MTGKAERLVDAAELRRQAERVVREETARSPDDGAVLSPDQARKTLHELRVHQVQLEMQNQELRRARLELEASHARYFDLYDLAPVGYVTISEAGLILEANLRAASLLGTPRGSIGQTPLTRFILSEDQDLYYLHRRRLFETTEPQACELRMVHQDGTQFWAHLSATAARDEETGALVCRLVVSDITERKRADQALRQQTIELQSRNLELNAFAHTVAHDLKAPLTVTAGSAELLNLNFATLSEESRRASLASILRNSRRMASIIDELLLLSEVRRADVALHRLDTPALVAEARERLADLIASSGTEIVAPSQWPAALGYGPWVAQVWTNYLSNAIRHGGRPPRVELGADTETDGRVRFWVRDNGDGVSPERQDLLFTPFTHLEHVGAHGHGLGLSIVRRITEKLGGRCGFESLGRGSVFHFSLPGAEGVRG